jgi:hypothetical protein
MLKMIKSLPGLLIAYLVLHIDVLRSPVLRVNCAVETLSRKVYVGVSWSSMNRRSKQDGILVDDCPVQKSTTSRPVSAVSQ